MINNESKINEFFILYIRKMIFLNLYTTTILYLITSSPMLSKEMAIF